MKPIYLLAFILSSLVASAQPVFIHSQIPLPGTQLEYYILNDYMEPPSLTGENQTWNFSEIESEITETINYLLPSEISSSESFPQSTLVVERIGSFMDTSYIFCHYDEDAFYVDGYDLNFFLNSAQIFGQPYQNYIFPLSYPDNYSGETYIFNKVYAGYSGIDSIFDKSFYQLSAFVDAWGTATIGSNAYEVIQIKINEQITDSVFYRMEGADEFQFQYSATQTLNRTEFIAPETGIIVCDIKEAEGDKGMTVYDWRFFNTGSIITSTKKPVSTAIHAFPNPNSERLFLDREHYSNLKFSIINLSGAILAEGNTGNAAEIITSDLKNGYYFLKLFSSSNEVISTQPFIVKNQ